MENKLKIFRNITLDKGRLLMGFDGWMDGGGVSTGTIKRFVNTLCAEKVAAIDSNGFYIQNFPGTMELTALFRPYTVIKDGLVKIIDEPQNEFYYCETNELLLFTGKEPNLHWDKFVDCIFALCRQTHVQHVYFIGSVAGLVPHTREPRIMCSYSDFEARKEFEQYGFKSTNYEGPASLITYMTARANLQGLKMTNLVATVPAYVQGTNPKCIESVTRRIANILGLHIELDDMRDLTDEFEKKVNEIVQEQPELADNISKLEQNYDSETFNDELGDLKQWLRQKGVRLD